MARSIIKTKLLEINIMNKITQLQQTAISTINGGLNMLPHGNNIIPNPFFNINQLPINEDPYFFQYFTAIPANRMNR